MGGTTIRIPNFLSVSYHGVLAAASGAAFVAPGHAGDRAVKLASFSCASCLADASVPTIDPGVATLRCPIVHNRPPTNVRCPAQPPHLKPCASRVRPCRRVRVVGCKRHQLLARRRENTHVAWPYPAAPLTAPIREEQGAAAHAESDSHRVEIRALEVVGEGAVGMGRCGQGAV